jgi:hypothetical protein
MTNSKFIAFFILLVLIICEGCVPTNGFGKSPFTGESTHMTFFWSYTSLILEWFFYSFVAYNLAKGGGEVTETWSGNVDGKLAHLSKGTGRYVEGDEDNGRKWGLFAFLTYGLFLLFFSIIPYDEFVLLKTTSFENLNFVFRILTYVLLSILGYYITKYIIRENIKGNSKLFIIVKWIIIGLLGSYALTLIYYFGQWLFM